MFIDNMSQLFLSCTLNGSENPEHDVGSHKTFVSQ
jgi:hypothetical protein